MASVSAPSGPDPNQLYPVTHLGHGALALFFTSVTQSAQLIVLRSTCSASTAAEPALIEAGA